MSGLSLIHAKTLLIVAAMGVAPTLTSCKRGPTRDQREITEHFDKPEREAAEIAKKVAEYFKDAPYTIQVSQTLTAGSLKDGTVTKEDLLKMKFSLLILYPDDTTSEQRQEIDQGLRSILTHAQYQNAMIGSFRLGETGQEQLRLPISPSFPRPSGSLPSSEAPRPE